MNNVYRSILVLLLIFSCSEDNNEDIDNNPAEQTKEESIVENPTIENPNNGNPVIEAPKVNEDLLDSQLPIIDNSWELIFSENFATNLDQWFIWEGGAFNNEIQLYRNEQLTLENGILSINAKREAVTGDTSIFDDTQKNFDYVSGRIQTMKQFGPTDREGDQVYRIMARIKLPIGNGMWPAFWSFADPWPTLGELDFFEARGNAGTKLESNIFYGVEPLKVLTKQKDTKRKYTGPVDLRQDFHNYEAEWSKSGLILKVDDIVYAQYTSSTLNGLTQMFGSQHNIILNMAVGGVFFNGVNPTTFVNNSTMEIDWVRVYKK